MRKALEGPNSRKKTKQQTKQQGPHWGARRDSADGPREREREEREESREQRGEGERRQRPPRRARCAPASATQRCGASVRVRRSRASRRSAPLPLAVRAWRRDACVRRPRIPRRSFPGSSAADATRASASLSHPVVRAADCTARDGRACFDLRTPPAAAGVVASHGVSRVRSRERMDPGWPFASFGCFVCWLVFFREPGPSNAFLIRKLTPYTPSDLLRPLILNP